MKLIKFNKLNLNTLLYIVGSIALLLAGYFLIWWQGGPINISGRNNRLSTEITGDVSPLTGEPCADFNRRPIAVMMASDPVARPLAGISQADVVFEMPVTPNSVTRMMAIFQCQSPSEIGSIRSARQDFVPLAKGFDAIYAHWGGERDVLNKLDAKIIDNIDAMKYDGTVFYRKKGVKPPHNGFTTTSKLIEVSEKLKYSSKSKLEGWPHTTDSPPRTLSNIAETVDNLGYLSPYSVSWQYDLDNGLYRRMRDGTPEIDALDNSQVTARVVIVMDTTSTFLYDQYISVKVVGLGNATIYQDGIYTSGIWKKETESSKLFFYDTAGNEIKLLPGKIWIEIRPL